MKFIASAAKVKLTCSLQAGQHNIDRLTVNNLKQAEGTAHDVVQPEEILCTASASSYIGLWLTFVSIDLTINEIRITSMKRIGTNLLAAATQATADSGFQPVIAIPVSDASQLVCQFDRKCL